MNKCQYCGTMIPEGQNCPVCGERQRAKEIRAIAKKFKMEEEGEQFVESGQSADAFKALIVERFQTREDSFIHSSGGADAESRIQVRSTRGPFIGKRWGEMFMLSRDEYSPDEWASMVIARDPRLKRAMSEGVGAAGGYLLPSLVAEMFMDNAVEESIVLPRCKIYPMSTDSIRVPAWQLGDHSANVYGGIAQSWKGEGLSADETEPKLREITFQAQKLFLYSTATNELIKDTGVVGALSQAFKTAAAYFLDSVFMSGDGAGKPLGILADGNAALLKVSRNTAGTIKYVDLTGMLAKLTPASFKNAVWVAHPSTLTVLASLIVYDGANAIDHYPLISESGAMRLLSRPVLISEKCGTLGSNYDLALIDFSQYGVGMRQDIYLQSNEGELFRSDKTAFRLTVRCDGNPLWDSPLTLQDGVSQVSPYVALI